MPRRSPRSRRNAKKSGDAPRVPSSPRVRSAPGQSRTRASRAAHALGGARPAKAAAKPARKAAASRARPVAGGKKKVVRKKAAARPTTGRLQRPVTRTRPAAASSKSPASSKKRSRHTLTPDLVRVNALLAQLRELYPDAKCALDFSTPLQLLIATILSAQCTDERVNKTTPALFARFPTAQALAEAPLSELEALVRSTGFFRNKAKSIKEACADIVAKHGGQVPRTLDELFALRGVGRKTANVVLGNAFGINSGVVVDTHVTRLANRLGLTTEQDAVKIEYALMPLVPQESWTLFSHWLILHGRAVCNARKPHCSACPLSPHCPKVGVTVSQ